MTGASICRALIVGVTLVATSNIASADRREASLHAHVVGGLAATGDAGTSESGSSPLGGLGLRASYATHDSFQYDVGLSFLATTGAQFGSATFMPTDGSRPITGPYTIPTQITRLDVPEFVGSITAANSFDVFKFRQGEMIGTVYGFDYVKQCGQLPGAFAGQCSMNGSDLNAAYRPNADGYIVWVGQGNTLAQGITNNLWRARTGMGSR